MEETALSGAAPSTLCAALTTLSSLLKAQAVVEKLLATDCRGQGGQAGCGRVEIR